MGGWEISGITTVESGQSVSFSQNTRPIPGRRTTRRQPVRTREGSASTSITSFPVQTSSQACLRVARILWPNGSIQRHSRPPSVTSERPGRACFLGPGLQNWDLAAIRNVKVGERFSFQLRGEFFNAFNHVNFSTVDTNVDSSTYGRLTGDHIPRNIQLGLKLYF